MSAECRTRRPVSSTHVACSLPATLSAHPQTLSYHIQVPALLISYQASVGARSRLTCYLLALVKCLGLGDQWAARSALTHTVRTAVFRPQPGARWLAPFSTDMRADDRARATRTRASTSVQNIPQQLSPIIDMNHDASMARTLIDDAKLI